jgi:hypothetical protein
MDFLSMYYLGQVDENIFLIFWPCSISVQIFYSLPPVIDIHTKIPKKACNVGKLLKEFFSTRFAQISTFLIVASILSST